nr:TPA_exp: acyl-CoA/ACP ligase [uncultured bacterium]
MNHWLFKRLGEYGEDTALISQGRQYSYAQMLDRTQHWLERIKSLGIEPGQSISLEGDYSFDSCTLMMALIENRNIIMPISASVKDQRERFFDIGEVEGVFSFNQNDDEHFHTRSATCDNELLHQIRKDGEPGLIVFSSGSTGEHKASLHSFNRVLDKFKERRRKFCTIVFLLMDHLGGINTLFYVLCNGGSIVPASGRNAEEICQTIERCGVDLLPTTPTFLNMLLISEAYKKYDLSSLKLITYGTEPMPENTLKNLYDVFPDVQLKQTYGLSEVGALPTKSKDSGSLWLKVGSSDFETKIVDGILWIRAKSNMLGYLNAPSPFDEDGWLKTEDAVEEKDGYLRIIGRTSDIINVGGEKVYPAEVENVLLQIENIRDVVVFGKKNPLMGQVVGANVYLQEEEDPSAVEERIWKFSRNKLAEYKIPMFIKICDEEIDQLYLSRFKKLRTVSGRV